MAEMCLSPHSQQRVFDGSACQIERTWGRRSIHSRLDEGLDACCIDSHGVHELKETRAICKVGSRIHDTQCALRFRRTHGILDGMEGSRSTILLHSVGFRETKVQRHPPKPVFADAGALERLFSNIRFARNKDAQLGPKGSKIDSTR